MKHFLQKAKAMVGAFNLTEFEVRLFDELRKNLPEDFRDILDSQLAEFNQTDRLIGESRGALPPYGHTSFYKNRWGRSSQDFKKRFPSNKDNDVLATMEVVDGDETISVEFTLVRGVLFSIKYRSPTKQFIPRSEDFNIRSFKLLVYEDTFLSHSEKHTS